MTPPIVTYITQSEFDEAEDIYVIISDTLNKTHAYFELNGKKYYIGYASDNIIKVELTILEKENYLLVGVDQKVVVLNILKGNILFSIGLYSFFKGFQNNNDLSFTIFSEFEDIIINKNGLSISQTIPHELDY